MINCNKQNQQYEEMSNILSQLSNRTLELKSTNIKVLNALSSDFNLMSERAASCAKSCLNQRNGL